MSFWLVFLLTGVRRTLQQRTTGNDWNAEDEAFFEQRLEQEVDKIYTFQAEKVCRYAFHSTLRPSSGAPCGAPTLAFPSSPYCPYTFVYH